ncbi:hypothetical protein N3K66_008797 [Trichothecium roseum]|uniref:Uncharacterized protein n=1 Tax=Trichothecium roseum TaxID=47278 RepID=A0ACC0USC4_9HYPO|nr:hypothetical protein N3K66_008797 [Trichothecium roseum]
MPSNPETDRHPGTAPRRVRPMGRTAVADSRDNLPSVLAHRAADDDDVDDPGGPRTNVYAELQGHTWGSHIGIGTCAPEGEALASEMLRQVAACRGPGTEVVIEAHPLGPRPSPRWPGREPAYYISGVAFSRPDPVGAALLSGPNPPSRSRSRLRTTLCSPRAALLHTRPTLPRCTQAPAALPSPSPPPRPRLRVLGRTADSGRRHPPPGEQEGQGEGPALLYTEADPLDTETDLPEDETYSPCDDADEEKKDDEDEANAMEEEMSLLREEGDWWEVQKSALQAEIGSRGLAIY